MRRAEIGGLQEENDKYRLHRHEGAVGIVDCAIDEA